MAKEKAAALVSITLVDNVLFLLFFIFFYLESHRVRVGMAERVGAVPSPPIPVLFVQTSDAGLDDNDVFTLQKKELRNIRR